MSIYAFRLGKVSDEPHLLAGPRIYTTGYLSTELLIHEVSIVHRLIGESTRDRVWVGWSVTRLV